MNQPLTQTLQQSLRFRQARRDQRARKAHKAQRENKENKEKLALRVRKVTKEILVKPDLKVIKEIQAM
ncbi:MAG: hypothetical protein KJO20_10090 [Eudoraea sp.]|nr:hypothetical protein [Eudoraea sp.]